MNFSSVNQFTSIIVFVLFPIVKNGDVIAVDVTLVNNDTGNGIIVEDVSTMYDKDEHSTEDDSLLLGVDEGDYNEDIFSGRMYARCIEGKCRKCEICVNNECLPYVMGAVFNQDCSLKDHCLNNTDCGDFECVYSYGDYFCRCPSGKYGKHCDKDWPVSGQDVPFTDLQAIYPAVVAAGTPVMMMAMWKDKEHLARDVRFVYKTDDVFAEKLDVDSQFIKAQISPRTSCEDYEMGEVCNGLPMELTYTGSFWRTEFPFLEFGELSDSVRIHRVLPENRLVLGYKQTFILTVFYKDSPSVVSSSHEIFVYYSDTRLFLHKCFPKMINPNPPCVRSLSEEESMYRQVLIKNQLLIKAYVPVMEDLECKQIQLTYAIWRGREKDPIYNVTGDVVDLEPYLLKAGNYRVKITVVSKWGTGRGRATATNFMRCWFEVVAMPLVAEIAGGYTRTVYAYDDLIMDASPSKDPNSPPSRQTNLFFTWCCNETDVFCQNITTKARKYVIKAPLRVGVTFKFQLTVYAFQKEPAYDWQVITTSAIELASFFIQCSKNCHTLTNPDKVTYLQINVTNEDYPIGKFNWTYSSSEILQPLPLLNVGMLTSKTSYDVAIIRGDFFKHGSQYTFYAERNEPFGFAKMMISTCREPSFSCDISPKLGTQLLTKFSIYCSFNSSEPYNYTFYTNVENSVTLPLYIDINTKGQLKDIMLYYRRVRVMAMADTGCFKINTLSVKLKPLNINQLNREQIQSKLTFLKEHIKDGKKELWDPSYGGYLNLLVYISLFAKKHKLGEVFKWEYVLDIVDKVEYKEPFDTKRFLSVVTHLSKLNSFQKIDDDFENELWRISSHVYDMLSYYRKYKIIWNNDLLITSKEQKQIAKSFFNYITRVLDTLGTTQNSLLEDRLLSRDPELHRGHQLYHLIGSKDVPNDDYIKPDLINHKHFHRQNMLYKQMMDLTEQATDAIQKLVIAIFRRMLPMEPGIFFSTRNYTLFIRIDSPKYFMLFNRIPLTKQNTSYIRIGRKLGEELQETSPYINLEVTILNQDPYWWDDDTTVIHSQIVHPFIALYSQRRWRVLHMLPIPLDIFLKVKQIESVKVSGMTQLPEDHEPDSDKDLSVTIYRLTPPNRGGHGKLFLELEIPSEKSLRVSLTRDFRPDFKFMMYHSLILTNKSALISLAYEMGDDDSFLYVGILPGPRQPPRVVVEVSFRAYIVQCLIRMNAMWISECQVGNETIRTLVHCQCRSLASLVGSTIIPPLVLAAPLHQFVFYRDEIFNVIPFAGLAVLVAVLACIALWACVSNRDKYVHDKVIVLEDNFPGEEWAYLVGVYTGTCWSAGTSSNVGIKLLGELSNSRAHILRSSHHRTLNTYSDSWFLIFTTEKLGTIKELHLWLDYSGHSPSWYCRKVIVYDFSGERKYTFRLDTWFYVSVASDMVEVKVQPIDAEHRLSFYHLLMDNLIYGFREMHYVLSIFKHHPRSFITSGESVASFANSLMFVVAFAVFLFKYDNGGPEDYAFYQLRSFDFLIGAILTIPAMPIATMCQFLFKYKVVTNHMKTWNLQPRQQNRIVEKDATEGKEKDEDRGSNRIPENVNTKQVLQKLSTAKEKYVCQQVPITINHEFADRLQIVRKRLYIAWATVASTFVGLCLFVLVLGYNMAEVKSMVCATIVLIAVLILPIFTCFNITAQMFLITLFDKRACDEPTLACDPRLGTRLEVLGDRQYLDRLLARRSQPEYHPLRTKRLQEIRHKEEKKLLKAAFLDIALSLMVFGMVFSNIQNSWSNDFHLKDHLKMMVSSGIVDTSIKLQHVKDLFGLQNYLRDTIGHVNYRRQWYNGEYIEQQGDRFSETGWSVDYTSRLIGVMQLRQKRVKEVDCMPYLLKHLLDKVKCFPSVTEVSESRLNHSMGWAPGEDDATGSFQSPWRYQSSQQDSPSIHYGKSGQWYSSGGYVVSLGRTLLETRATCWKLQESTWVDKSTRVLFVDFCVFNPNINRISTISICVEFRPSGTVFHKIKILTSTVGFKYIEWHTLIWIVFGFAIIFMGFRLIISINKSGFTFLLSIWNILDICIVILFGINYVVNLTNILHTVFSIQNYLSSSSEAFFPYIWTGYYYSKFILIYFFLIITCTVRMFKHFIQTFQVIPVLSTLLSASPHILKISAMVFPMLYIKTNVIQSLLFNTQQSMNYIPLANRVDLSNYCNNFNFPDAKFVPYLHCQFCSLLIFIFSILIIYHYRIAKYNTRIISVTVDVIHDLRDRIRKRRQRNHVRLRGGADKTPVSLPSRDTICLLAIQELLQPPPIHGKESNLKPMKNLVNSKIKHDKAEQASHRKMSAVLQNMDSKLDKILNSLKELHDSL